MSESVIITQPGATQVIEVPDVNGTTQVYSDDTTVVDVGYSQPAGSSGSSFQQEFQRAATVWNVNHNLGYNPAVTAADASGRYMIADILYIDNNNLTVTFNYAQIGTVYCS